MVIYIWLLACVTEEFTSLQLNHGDLHLIASLCDLVQWSFVTVLYLIEVVLDNLLFCARSTVDLAV